MSAFKVKSGNIKPGIIWDVSSHWCNIHLPREGEIPEKKSNWNKGVDWIFQSAQCEDAVLKAKVMKKEEVSWISSKLQEVKLKRRRKKWYA